LKKKQSDAAVGIVILLSFVVLLSGVIWLKKISLTRSMVTYTVLFPKIGGLQTGDPVRINGVENGSVTSIRLKDAEVAVQFKIDSEIPFTDSATITVNNIGLMGERGIEVVLSRAGTEHIPNVKGEEPDQYIPGFYDSGISEAIGMLGNIMGEAQGLIDTVQYILGSTVGDDQFIQFWGDAVQRLDTMTLVLERIVTTNENQIDGIVTDMKSVSNQLDEILATNSNGISSIVSNADTLTQEVRDIMGEADSLLLGIQELVSRVDSGDGTIAQLLNNDDLSVEMRATLQGLDEIIDEIDSDGLKLRVKLGFKDTPSNSNNEDGEE